MKDRRRFPRTQMSLPTEGRLLGSAKYFHTVSKDISLVGIRILGNEFLPQGHFLKLDINLIERMLALKAKIVWCNKERLSDRYQIGLEFLELDNENRICIAEFLRGIN